MSPSPSGWLWTGGLLRKIPRHLFSSGPTEQPYVAANVGVKAAICQQKTGFFVKAFRHLRTHFSGQRVSLVRNVALLWVKI